ncbi:sulfite exporter TauE/SafE family protein [Saccharothrix mutabilis subsp. mutabilis]|uniref:Probable membrane transporter protein n=1 Tax=Saccharothrix mutabilis subsp. mutabilis TaxID=66855 RepID=A0ABP3EC17_9PSEU
MLVLTVALAVVVGVALGLLGGGGSILMVPLLVYVAGMGAKEAIVASLVVVGVTSAVGVVGHARAGHVRWRTGLLFGLAGMAGAFAGGLVGGHLPGPVLMGAFAVMMVATAVAMLRGRRTPAPAARTELPVVKVLVEGAVVGLVTGLVGAGGGFLVVPALALLGGLPMSVAVGTSLLVIAMKSIAGLAGYLATVPIDWAFTGVVTAAAVAGSLVGARLVARVPGDALRRGFGWFVLAMGAFVLAQQAPEHLRVPALLVVAGIGVAVGTCVGFVPRCPLRHIGGKHPVPAAGR